jgi:hypothetical protein
MARRCRPLAVTAPSVSGSDRAAMPSSRQITALTFHLCARFSTKRDFPHEELKAMDRTVDAAIIGMGNVWRPVARRATIAGLRVIGLDINLDVDDLFESLRNADICVLPHRDEYGIDAMAMADQLRAEARALRRAGASQSQPQPPSDRAG